MSSDDAPVPRPASKAALDRVDAILGESEGKRAIDVDNSCTKAGVQVEIVDLDQNPWGEVQNDKQEGRVRLWTKAGIVVSARRG